LLQEVLSVHNPSIVSYDILQKLVVMMVSPILTIFGTAVFFSSFSMHTHQMRKVFVGSIGLVVSVLMYGSPLVAVVSIVT
jgi:solute carrier family 50 protein (sugar transporter)